MVNQEFVKRLMGGQNPLGQFVSFGSASCAKCSAEIVGVSGNAMVGRDVTDEFRPVVYVPYTMDVWGGLREMYFELRTAGNPMALAGTVRELVREADPRLPVSDMQTQRAVIDGTMNREVIFARLCSGFAVLALLIACVGLYGSMSYNVARRTGEIGIRMALGAPRRSVIWMVLGEVAAAGRCGPSHRHSGGTDGVEAGEIFSVSSRAARSAHHGGSRGIAASCGDSGGISAGKIGGEDRSDVRGPPRISMAGTRGCCGVRRTC